MNFAYNFHIFSRLVKGIYLSDIYDVSRFFYDSLHAHVILRIRTIIFNFQPTIFVYITIFLSFLSLYCNK